MGTQSAGLHAGWPFRARHPQAQDLGERGADGSAENGRVRSFSAAASLGPCRPWHQGAAGAGVGVPARLTALPGLVSRPVISPGAGHFSLTVLSLWRRVRAWQTAVQFILQLDFPGYTNCPHCEDVDWGLLLAIEGRP